MNIFATLHLLDIEIMNYFFITPLHNSEVSKYPSLPLLILIAGEQIKYPDDSHLCYLLKTDTFKHVINSTNRSISGFPWSPTGCCFCLLSCTE